MQVRLGIDIGTTFCKVSVIDRNGVQRRSNYRKTPTWFLHANADFNRFVANELCPLIESVVEPNSQILSVGVCAVAPSLVAFSRAQSPRVVFSHLTPVNTEWVPQENVSDAIRLRRSRTDLRLAEYYSESCIFLPLSHSILYSLTGEVPNIDLANCYELGFDCSEDLISFCRIENIKGKSNSYNLASPIFVPVDGVFASTDTVGSLIGCGALKSKSGMLHFGSYFSALELHTSISEILNGTHVKKSPYTWHVSLPRYGKFLESILRIVLPNKTLEESFEEWQTVLFGNYLRKTEVRVGFTGKNRSSDAEPTYSLSGLTDQSGTVDILLALAEFLGLELKQVVEADNSLELVTWYATGGVSSIAPLVDTTSAKSGLKICRNSGLEVAHGAALLTSLS